MDITITQTQEELLFAQEVDKLKPILATLTELLTNGRMTLTGQKYRMENNHLKILAQEKQITENQGLIDNASKRAASIISVAEEKAKEVDLQMRTRVAQINHMEREAKQKLEEADKVLWNAKEKKAVKA